MPAFGLGTSKKVIVGFHRFGSGTVFERHRSRVPIYSNELRTLDSISKHLIAFLGIKELAVKYQAYSRHAMEEKQKTLPSLLMLN